ncbi:MAG: hypothetical protein ACRD6W_08595 [Nitrososphaerales archaeon]
MLYGLLSVARTCSTSAAVSSGKLSPALPLPKELKDRDPLQRIHAVIDALYRMTSATQHTDPPIKDFVPIRADAVAVAAGAASVAKQVFAWLDKP